MEKALKENMDSMIYLRDVPRGIRRKVDMAQRKDTSPYKQQDIKQDIEQHTEFHLGDKLFD